MGKYLRTIGSECQGRMRAEAIAVDSAGNFLVCDNERARDACRVQIFRSDGSFVTAFGKPRDARSDYASLPQSICIDDDGSILVACGNVVNVFGFCD